MGQVPDLPVRIFGFAGHYLAVSFYRRRLPHWQPEGASIFLTWRLYGSLPRDIELPVTEPHLTEGNRFRELDLRMDRAAAGPTWLKHPQVASSTVHTLLLGAKQWELYDLFAWVVMSNHVHVLVQPHKPVCEVTRAVKSGSARQANRILGRSGSRFWQDESYDHWVRDAGEFNRIVRYIEWNPIQAGLAERPEDWRWSSAYPKLRDRQVGDLPHE